MKQGTDQATWISTLGYLPGPGNRQLSAKAPKNTERSSLQCGQNVSVAFVRWNKYQPAVQRRCVPGEADTDSFKIDAASAAAPGLGWAGESSKGARKWHCDLT